MATSAAQKAAATRKRRTAARKAATTRKRRAAGKKAAITPKRRTSVRNTAPVPSTPSVVPMISYEDGIAALGWLRKAFGFRETARLTTPDGKLSHGEMEAGKGLIMLASPTPEIPQSETSSGGLRTGTQVVYGALDYRWRARLRGRPGSTFQTSKGRRCDDSL